MNSRKQLLTVLEEFFRLQAEEFQVEMAFLFGSRAHGAERRDSDVDLALLFEEHIDEDGIFDRITRITLRLAVLLAVEVSILPIHYDFRKPMLYYNAVVKGFPLFVRNRERYVRFRYEAIVQMEDFQMFGTRWQIEAARRNLAHG